MTGDRVSKRRPYFETNTYVLVGSIGNAETVYSTQTTEQNRTEHYLLFSIIQLITVTAMHVL